MPSMSWDTHNTTLDLRLGKHQRKKGWKECKSLGLGCLLLESECLLYITEMLHP